MNEALKTVARFSDPMSAEITAGMLNAAIDSIEVKVNADDYESAKKLLAANESAE